MRGILEQKLPFTRKFARYSLSTITRPEKPERTIVFYASYDNSRQP